MGTWVRVNGKIDIDLCTIYVRFMIDSMNMGIH